MRRTILLLLGVLLAVSPALGQSASSDSQTLQAILQELRGLRQDLRTVTVTSQRAQILFFRVQSEQESVARAQQQLDDARSALSKAQNHRQGIEREVQYYKDQDNEDRTPNPAERQRIESNLPRMKGLLQEAQADEQQAQSREMTAKDKLQLEQSNLDNLKEELDRLDKSLANLTRQ
jgi:chromosome segregation ATPase